jgi:RNA polymerase primary sigma factor
LDERDADILRMRWGADGTQEMKSLEEVGRKYNLTRERIRQIEKRAFTTLRDSPSVYMRLHPWLD